MAIYNSKPEVKRGGRRTCPPQGLLNEPKLGCEGAEIGVRSTLNLAHNEVGQGDVAIGVEGPFTQGAFEVLDREDSSGDGSAVSGVATSGANIFDRLQSSAHGIVAHDRIRFLGGAELGFVIGIELLTSIAEVLEGQAGGGGENAFSDISASAFDQGCGEDTIGADELDLHRCRP